MFDFTPPQAAQALHVVEKLQAAGFIAYLAGGCVRDAILARQPKDFDVATDATPDSVRGIFGRRRTLAFGASFGVIGVLGNAGTATEVATFRSDGKYSDGRRPDSVRFGSAEQDALRRDFTINGMFYDPLANTVIDFVNGEADLKGGLIRAIGDPATRIAEDKLRMLRAVRFAAGLGFELDPDTRVAIGQYAAEVTVVSGERIGAEMRRMLASRGASRAMELLVDTCLLAYVWPTLAENIENQAGNQLLADLQRLLNHIEFPNFVVAVAAIIARLESDVVNSVRELTTRWKLSCDEQRAISLSVRNRETILRAHDLPWSQLQPLVASSDAVSIIATAATWAAAVNRSNVGVSLCRTRLAWPREQLEPPPLLTGDTLRDLGYTPGPNFREVLQTIRNEQLDLQLTTQSAAIARAEALLQRGDRQ